MDIRRAARAIVERRLLWEVLVVAQWYAIGWILGLVLPGDPLRYALWVKVAIFGTYTIAVLVGNYALRRHLLRTPRPD